MKQARSILGYRSECSVPASPPPPPATHTLRGIGLVTAMPMDVAPTNPIGHVHDPAFPQCRQYFRLAAPSRPRPGTAAMQPQATHAPAPLSSRESTQNRGRREPRERASRAGWAKPRPSHSAPHRSAPAPARLLELTRREIASREPLAQKRSALFIFICFK